MKFESNAGITVETVQPDPYIRVVIHHPPNGSFEYVKLTHEQAKTLVGRLHSALFYEENK